MAEKDARQHSETRRRREDTDERILMSLASLLRLEVKFATWAEKKGLKRRNLMMLKSKRLFETALYGNIIYNMLGMEAYIQYLNKSDKTVQKALEVLKEGKSFPEAPVPTNNPKNDEKTVAQLDTTAKKTILPTPTYDVVYQLA